ncbi:MAG: MalY/PatB family protein [Candidatus Spyradocola sp.]
MDFHLLESIDRRNTKCSKWDTTPPGVLPMWVADMDFPCAPGIVDALRQRIAHPVFGYTRMGDDDKQAIVDYYARHHGMKLCAEEMLFTPGVVDSLLLAVHALTQPGDKVLIQSPVYGPFSGVIRRAKREIVENPLVQTESGRYEIDLADLDKRLAECKLMLLCSPHNPCGRVWERETLQTVLDLCKKHRVPLVADEIHCDFVFDGKKHVSALTLTGAETGVAVAVSATKTFNIAGLNHSTFLIPDPDLRKALSDKANEIGMGGGNLLGVLATTAAYQTGDEWLEAVKEIIVQNRDYAVRELRAAGAKVYPNEGTYLLWLDLRHLHMSSEALQKDLVEKAKVRLNAGSEYGALGDGFLRLNLAAPPKLIEEGVGRIASYLRAQA